MSRNIYRTCGIPSVADRHDSCFASNDVALDYLNVNHSVEYVTAEGIHTNTIEETWCAIKRHIPKNCYKVNHSVE